MYRDPHICFYAYAMCPIDFGLKTLLSADEVAKRWFDDEATGIASRLAALQDLAMSAFRALGMGELRLSECPPGFFMLPMNDCEMGIGFMVKEDNNGTTYVASPVQLTWLNEHLRLTVSLVPTGGA